MVTALYPGTFDPITNGHSDLVRRAARLFNEVVVAIALNPGKEPVFTLAERIGMAEHVLGGLPNIRVCGFSGLLVDFARESGAQVILRGLRAVSDFEFEFQLAGMNRRLDSDIETAFLTPAEQYAFVSSSLVREVAALGGDVSTLVDEVVVEALKQKRR